MRRGASPWLWIALLAPGPLPACAEGGGPTMHADVLAVETAGPSGALRFRVTLQSPDEGCSRYADWWEVIHPDGALTFRRILRHSHPDEQPFTRDGGPIAIGRNQVVIVRGHMHPTGYGGVAFRGSADTGFSPWRNGAEEFASGLEDLPPQPDRCLF